MGRFIIGFLKIKLLLFLFLGLLPRFLFKFRHFHYFLIICLKNGELFLNCSQHIFWYLIWTIVIVVLLIAFIKISYLMWIFIHLAHILEIFFTYFTELLQIFHCFNRVKLINLDKFTYLFNNWLLIFFGLFFPYKFNQLYVNRNRSDY